jgi:hypothetical protein
MQSQVSKDIVTTHEIIFVAAVATIVLLVAAWIRAPHSNRFRRFLSRLAAPRRKVRLTERPLLAEALWTGGYACREQIIGKPRQAA